MSNSAYPNAQSLAGGAIPVYIVTQLPANIVTGSQAATGSAAALSSQAVVNYLTISAPLTNEGDIYVGASGVTTSTGRVLVPGASIGFVVTNADQVYIIGATASAGSVNWTAS